MKSERKYFYALTLQGSPRRERTLAIASPLIRRRIWASAIRGLRLATRAAYALAHPAIEAGKKMLVLTALESGELFKCFMNGYGDGDFVESYCQTAGSKAAFARVQKKMREQWSRKN